MNTLLKTVFAGFIFLLPLYYSFETQQIFEVNKFFLLSVFTGIIAGGMGIMMFSKKQKIFSHFLFQKKSRKFWFFSGLFFLSILCSSLFAQTPITAFLGGTSRHQGMIFLGMIFFLLLATLLLFRQEKKQITEIQHFLVYPLLLTAFISSALAISQYYGNFSGYLGFFDFHSLQIQDVSMRSLGAMGQPNFLAQTLLLPFFISITLAVHSLSKNKKQIFQILLSLLGAGIILFGIHTTLSRAGEYIGIGSGIVISTLFLLLYYLKESPEKKQKIFWRIFSVFLVITVSMVSYIFYHPEILTVLGERARSVLARMQFWKEALPLITQNISTFFFGIGGDNLGSTFQRIASVRLNELEGFSYSPDRTHTIFLDFLIHYGVIATVIFWGFLLRIFWNSTQIFFDSETTREKKIWIAGIFSGLIATIGSWSVGFYVTTDATIFSIFLGILILLTQKSQDKKDNKTLKNIIHKTPLFIFSALLCIFAIGIFFVAHLTKASDRAKYQSTLPDSHPEKTLTQKEIKESLSNAPQLEENFLSQFSGLQKDKKSDKNIIQTGKEKGFHSFTFYYQKCILEKSKESFMQAKTAAGNNIESHVALFQLVKSMGIFSETELISYAKEVFLMVPDKYYNPSNWMDPKIQKFWKHHSDFVIILEYADK